MKKTTNRKVFGLLLLSLIPLSACVAADYQQTDPKASVKYSVDFLDNGDVVVKDSKGNVLEGKPVNLPENPIPVKAIIDYDTIIEAQGSCLVIINGKLYNRCP
jgi:hypothetical protein